MSGNRRLVGLITRRSWSLIFISYCGSGVEQLTRNEQVVGSNPTSSSTPAVSNSRPQVFSLFWSFVPALVAGIFFVSASYQAEPGRNSRSGLSFLFYLFTRVFRGYLFCQRFSPGWAWTQFAFRAFFFYGFLFAFTLGIYFVTQIQSFCSVAIINVKIFLWLHTPKI